MSLTIWDKHGYSLISPTFGDNAFLHYTDLVQISRVSTKYHHLYQEFLAFAGSGKQLHVFWETEGSEDCQVSTDEVVYKTFEAGRH